MLNKLLKRCMPWQQRGKWVRVYYDGIVEDVHDITFRCPSDMTFTISQDGFGLNITCDRPVMVGQMVLTITQATHESVPETNIIFSDTNPNSMLGTRGYIDQYVIDLEVI